MDRLITEGFLELQPKLNRSLNRIVRETGYDGGPIYVITGSSIEDLRDPALPFRMNMTIVFGLADGRHDQFPSSERVCPEWHKYTRPGFQTGRALLAGNVRRAFDVIFEKTDEE